MDFLALTQRLHREALRSTASPSDPTSDTERNLRLFDKIADAWADLQRERDWKWMREVMDTTLTTNVQTYTGTGLGATRFGRWRPEDNEYHPWCYLSGSPNALFPLSFWQLDEFRNLYVYRQIGPTVPVAWTIDSQQNLLIGPAPNAGYKLRIDQWMEPSALVDATDEPDMPSRFHMYLVWDALEKVGTESAAPEIVAKAQANKATIRSALLLDQGRLPT